MPFPQKFPRLDKFLIASERMDEKELSKNFSELGKKGARKRSERLSAERRREIAKKAGEASGRARKMKANRKRKK